MNADESTFPRAGASTDVAAEREALLAEGSTIYREYLTAQVVVAHASAQALGLGATDFFGLNLIALAGSMTAGELAARTGLSTGAVTRLIDRLERAGYARRVNDPTDRRRVVVEGVPERQAEIDAALGPHRRRMAAMFADFDPARLRVLYDYFALATTALRAAAHEMLRPSRFPATSAGTTSEHLL